MAETHVVTLGDASVTTDDLALLMPPAWLNDRLLSFWFEHLRLHLARNSPAVALLPPSLTYLLCVVEPQALPSLLGGLHLARARVVLAALNSAAAASRHHHDHAGAAGTHWSLLVYRRAPPAGFRHYDSAPGGANEAVARAVAERLKPLVGARTAAVQHVDVARQRNSYDCGAYVCVFSERVVRRFMASHAAATAAQHADALGVETEPIEDEDDDDADDAVYGDAERLAVVAAKTRQEIGMVVSQVLHEQQQQQRQSQSPSPSPSQRAGGAS